MVAGEPGEHLAGAVRGKQFGDVVGLRASRQNRQAADIGADDEAFGVGIRVDERVGEAGASVEPQDPPNAIQRSIPAISRSRSMSATRCQVVFASSDACGRERPQPRWSNSIMS